MPKVLMACTHPYWSHLQVGSQHLARQFARHGWDVVYLSAPITALHLPRLSSPEVRARFKYAFAEPSSHENGRIRAFPPFSLIAPDGRPVLRHPLVTRNWYRTMIPSLKKILARAGADRVNLLYIDNLSYHFLLDCVQHDTSVFRVMDMHDHFPGWQGRAKALAQKIAWRADLTVYSAQGLESYVASLSPKQTALVPNGVDFEFFQSASFSDSHHPVLSSIPDPIILYVGMIDTWVDIDLVVRTARKNPEVSFVFVGPGSTKTEKLSAQNLYFLGSVSHLDMPRILRSAQAGMIPFDVDKNPDLIKGIRPLKLLEYMAAGLPVICARWPEVENMNSPAWFYKNEQQFDDLVQKAVSQSHDSKPYLDFARGQDWRNAFQLMLEALNIST